MMRKFSYSLLLFAVTGAAYMAGSFRAPRETVSAAGAETARTPLYYQCPEEKVVRLKKEIQEQQESERKGVSAEDISIFKKTLSAQADIPALLDGAAALKELGLMEEAAAEYEKLLQIDPAACDFSKSDCTPGKIICDYLGCILETQEAAEVVKKATKTIYKFNMGDKETARVHFWLGQQLEKREQHDLAFELYRAASEMDGSDAEILARLNALKGKLSNNSRYDYLLRKTRS